MAVLGWAHHRDAKPSICYQAADDEIVESRRSVS
jgi:hypothetical protein